MHTAVPICLTVLLATVAEAVEEGQENANLTKISQVIGLIKEAVGTVPFVGPFVADFEPTLSNVAIAFVLMLLFHFVFRSIFPADKNLPPFYNPGVPIMGGFLSFTSDPLGTIRRAYAKHGDCFTLRMFHKKITFLVGPEAHKTFFKSKGKDYDVELDQAQCYKFMTPLFGKGVVYDAPIKKRKQQFKFLSAALKASGLQKYPETIAKETSTFLKNNWGESGEVDLLQAMQDLTILTASATLLGDEIRHALYEEVSRLYRDLDEGLSHVSVFFPHLPTKAHRRRDKARKEIVSIFSRVIKKRREDIENGVDGAGKQQDLLQRLIDSTYDDGTSLTDDEITGLIIATLFAGQHTTNVSITWAIHFLTHNQKRHGGDLLERFLDEVHSLKETYSDESLWKVLQKMKFGNACIKETIRLHPPLIFLMRAVVQKRINAGRNNYMIPEGHTVMICNAVAMRLAEYFTNPDAYVPDRWMDDKKRREMARYSFVGFGGGTHSCMGESFAYMQIKTILSVVLDEYDMTPVGDFPKDDLAGMVVGPIGPTMMKYRRKTPEERARRNLSGTVSTATTVTSETSAQDIRLDKVKMTDTVSKLPQYTRTEVKRHCHENDMWIIVDDGVYDVTKFLPSHPGGSAALFALAGQDCTTEFYGPQHPDTVPTTLETYRIGVVAD
jgi:sterol 14-demethylase